MSGWDRDEDGERTMGRPKLPGKKARTVHIHLRLSPAMKEWFGEFVAVQEDTMTGLIMKSLKVYAKQKKFRQPPEE
jgi:hypothetical protein